jgi:hypothetical protein
MIIKAIKSTGLSIALAATFLVAAGSSSAFAQDNRGRDRDRGGWQDNRRERHDWQDGRRERFGERRPFGYPRFRFGGGYRDGFRGGHAQEYRRCPDNYGRRYGRGY